LRELDVSVASRRDLIVGAIALAVGHADRRLALASEAAVKPGLTNGAASSAPIIPPSYFDAPMLAPLVESGKLPPVVERLPKPPLVVNLKSRGREVGLYGGDLRSLVSRVHDLRLVTVYTYTRLVGYDEKLNLQPDLLEGFVSEDDGVFTLTLREAHRWSDGAPFTAEDFRFYFEDIANNAEISPVGPENIFFVEGKLARFEVLDEHRVRYGWDKPNPLFLPALAQARPVFIYAPAHYLKEFHARYAPRNRLARLAAKANLRSWAALFTRVNDPYENSNPDMPTLNSWKVITRAPANRFVFERNPYFHRVEGSRALGSTTPFRRLQCRLAKSRQCWARTTVGQCGANMRRRAANGASGWTYPMQSGCSTSITNS
jgi:peptide/nickel transport system substrate-binding protein